MPAVWQKSKLITDEKKKFINPFTDYGFKRLLGSEEAKDIATDDPCSGTEKGTKSGTAGVEETTCLDVSSG